MDAAFAVVRVDIEVLRVEMQSNSADSLSPTAEESIKHLCVQCEASLKFLHSLCQQNNFRDCLLKHKVFNSKIDFCRCLTRIKFYYTIVFLTYRCSTVVAKCFGYWEISEKWGDGDHSSVFRLHVVNCFL